MCDHAKNDEHFFRMLRTTAKRSLIDKYRRGKALVRRGWSNRLSLDGDPDKVIEIEAPMQFDPVETCCTRELQSLAEDCKEELRREYVAKGKDQLFEAYQGYITGPVGSRRRLGELAISHGLSFSAFRSGLSRLRKRYRELVSVRMAKAA